MSEKKSQRSGHSITAGDMIHNNSVQRLSPAETYHVLKVGQEQGVTLAP
jgi:hypothetical protein